MRTAVTLVMTAALTMALAACGEKRQDRAEADKKAASAGFTPPSVTSRLDFGAAMQRRFRRLDRNADDVITSDELPKTDSVLRGLDRNKDGRITAIEYSEGSLQWFDRIDLNKDGTLTSDERAQSKGLLNP